jgi:hypothetical protein
MDNRAIRGASSALLSIRHDIHERSSHYVICPYL